MLGECHCRQHVLLLGRAYSHRDVPPSLLQLLPPCLPPAPVLVPEPVQMWVSASVSASVKPGSELSVSASRTTGTPFSCRGRRSRCCDEGPAPSATTHKYAHSHAGQSLSVSSTLSRRYRLFYCASLSTRLHYTVLTLHSVQLRQRILFVSLTTICCRALYQVMFSLVHRRRLSSRD